MGRRLSVDRIASSELEGQARNQRARVEDELAVGELAWCELIDGELIVSELIDGELARRELTGCSPLTSPGELAWCVLVGALAWLEFAADELAWV